MPTKLASGEKKHIAQGRIEGVKIRDALQWRAMKAIQDNVLRASDLIPITWQNDCNLPDSSIRGLIAMPVTSSIKAKGNATLLLWRDGTGQLKCLFVEVRLQDGSARACLAVHAKVPECRLVFQAFAARRSWAALSIVMDVQLGIDRSLAIWMATKNQLCE